VSCFRDTDHLYEAMGALFTRMREKEAVAEKLLEGNLIIRFTYTDPDGQATVDLTKEPIAFVLGESDLEPDVEMSQSADTAHLFWLGRVNVPRAIATRRIVARGSVPKALQLLPAVKPAFTIYPEVLRELGYEDLIPPQKATTKKPLKAVLGKLLRGRPKASRIDYAGLNAHYIPLVEDEALAEEIQFAEQELPAEETALKIEMLRRMILIRAFEERLAQEFAQGHLPTEAVHLSIGQEACAVGACFALRYDDYMTTTHRGHGHMLAKGADPKGMMAELFGKATGLCKGKGGSMHVTDARVGALGANGIVGASALIATGAALSAKQRGTDQVALAFFGDGATNQGMFHEALNFAAVFDLPALYLIENNLYAEFTRADRHAKVERLSDRAVAYGLPGLTVDGNDAWAVYQATKEAVERARSGGGPTLIECQTYRIHGHTEGESAEYRSTAEVEQWRGRDPIRRWRKQLLDGGILTEEQATETEREAREAVEEAVAFATSSPDPPLESITEDIFSPEPAYLYEDKLKVPATREVTCSQAIHEALAEEMRRDPAAYLLGEDVTTGGYFAVTAGLVDEFGPQRVIDTPISEYAIVGTSVGAAMTGRRPIAEIQFSDFLTCCMDPIINQAAKLRYMSGGQYRLPLVVRTAGGAGIGMAAQHSQSLEALLTGIPGLIVIAPGTPYDAKGLLKSAIRSNNPVLFFENKLLYVSTGPIPEGEYLVPIGTADVKRSGRDVTLVAIGSMVSPALEVAAELSAEEGIEVEVLDPRTLVPLDLVTIVRSVVKTRRLVIAEEGHLNHGFGAEIAARVADVAWAALKTPIKRVAAIDTPIPYARPLENAVVPDAEQIRKTVLELF
jgi:2-oxoisovalerate dehydrogenase E1 component